MSHDWSQFKLRVSVKTYGHHVYDAWAKPGGLEKWFLSKAIFTATDGHVRAKDGHIQAGDTYEFSWFGHPDTMIERGRVLEADGKNSIKFTFAGDCVVTVIVKVEDGEVIAELVQENIPLDEKSRTGIYIGCSIGWTFYLANLKSVLEGGKDLRNKNVNLKQMVNA